MCIRDSYSSPDEITAQSFTPNTIEQQILQDRDPDFRVFNATVNPLYDTRSPYFFKPITGYNPARLSIYQNLIDKYLSGSPSENVLNMLNAKYIIFTTSQTNQQQMQPNPNAYGHCW